MIPINVTHTAIFNHYYHSMLLSPSQPPHYSGVYLPKPETPLRHTLSTLLSFFAETYKQTFGFMEGPPLHDALTVACIVKPEIFQLKRFRVDVELGDGHSVGQTVVDMWNYSKSDNSWGSDGKNCLVAQSVDVRFYLL
jgi:uridine nucleosidase